MKRVLIMAVILVPFALLGCVGKKHPAKLYVGKEMKAGSIEKIAVFPFASSLHHSDDPDAVAPRTMDMLFLERLDERDDYKFVAPDNVTYTLERADMEGNGQRFVEDWIETETVDTEFLRHLGEILNIDAVMINVVELWQKDEVDIQENATPTTYVGATVSILSVKDGTVLFQATDENFLEGARSETTDRSVQRSPSGAIYSDPRERLFRAPEYEEVAILVAAALVNAIPIR